MWSDGRTKTARKSLEGSDAEGTGARDVCLGGGAGAARAEKVSHDRGAEDRCLVPEPGRDFRAIFVLPSDHKRILNDTN